VPTISKEITMDVIEHREVTDRTAFWAEYQALAEPAAPALTLVDENTGKNWP
jgi:hypothetical protein